MSQYDFDLLVIGGGSGGVRLARWSGSLGARVGIIEESDFGGTCVIRGCVPKKMMSLGSHFLHEIEVMKDYGWTTATPQLNFSQFRKNRDKEISRLSGLYQGMLAKNNVEAIQGRGVVVDPHTVEVSGKSYSAQFICIAVGGRPWRPDIPGIEYTITSKEAFQLDSLPKSVAIVGTGYIGVEFAGIFNGFGSDVSMICRSESILNGFDHETRLFLHEQIKEKGVKTYFSKRIESIDKIDSGVRLNLTGSQSLEVDVCLVATGREPYTEGLGLESAGVRLGKNGQVFVDENYKTSVDSIYALGDCTDRMNLTPIATAEGTVLAEHLFGDGKRKMDYTNVPTAVFSDPTLATVGLSEEEAVALGHKLKVFKSSFRNLKFTLSEGGEKTFMKMIVDQTTDVVLGCHMVGKDAPEIIQGVAVAIKAGAKKADFDRTIGIHPSSAEEFVTMRG